MKRAVRGGDSSQIAFNDPCHRAFLELGRLFRSAMSLAWVDRHAARTIEWPGELPRLVDAIVALHAVDRDDVPGADLAHHEDDACARATALVMHRGLFC